MWINIFLKACAKSVSTFKDFFINWKALKTHWSIIRSVFHDVGVCTGPGGAIRDPRAL